MQSLAEGGNVLDSLQARQAASTQMAQRAGSSLSFLRWDGDNIRFGQATRLDEASQGRVGMFHKVRYVLNRLSKIDSFCHYILSARFAQGDCRSCVTFAVSEFAR
eukprot:9479977-Pyramimonas_sp.AAC.2